MNKYIKIGLWIMVIAMVIVPQLLIADLSPQHTEFLHTFFWDFPKAILCAWVPGL